METEDLSSNELETLFQQLSAELDTLVAEPFQNALLVRAALRALPLLTAGLPSPGKGASANLYFLSHLRCLVTQCCMAGASDDLDLASSIEAALTQEENASKQIGIWLPNGNVTILVRDTARRLSAYISEPSTSDILRHYLSFFAAAPYRREIEQIRKDLARLPYEPAELFGLKLTSSFGLLDWQEQLSQDCWAFWRTWYQGFLDGKPLDWKLQRRVALIDDAIWDAGPEAVAAEIERIRSLFELEQEVTRLKEQLATVERSHVAALIGDNGGPPLEDAPVLAFQTDLALIWRHVEELEEEMAKPEPSQSALNRLAQWFADFPVRASAYFGSKFDIVITKSAETIGTTGTKTLIAYLTASSAAQNEGIKGLAQAIWDFAKTLPPG